MKRYEQIASAGLTGISRRAMLGLITLGLSLALSLAASTALAQKGKPGGGGGDGGGGGGVNTANSAIAYIGGGALKVMDADGANQVRVLAANSKHQYQYPTWYPNGAQLLFRTTVNGSGFYRVNLDGTGLTKVVALNSTATYKRAEVSPLPGAHGQHRIVFTDTDSSGNRGVFVANEDGTGRTQLTIGSNYDPTWSPDGQQVAVVHYDDGNEVNPYTDGLRLLTLGEDQFGTPVVLDDALLVSATLEPYISFFHLSFSKTKQKLYVSVMEDWSSDDIWAFYLDDLGNPEQLTFTPSIIERDVSGSSDDSKIAYESGNTIYVANSDGSNPVAMPRPVVKGKSEVHRMPSLKR